MVLDFQWTCSPFWADLVHWQTRQLLADDVEVEISTSQVACAFQG